MQIGEQSIRNSGAAIQENPCSLQAWKTVSLQRVILNLKMYQLRFAFEETGSSKSASFLVNTNLNKQR